MSTTIAAKSPSGFRSSERRWALWFVIALLLATAVFFAVGRTGSTHSQASVAPQIRVTGTVLVEGGADGQGPGPRAPGAPVSMVVWGTTAAGGHITRSFTTGASGRFVLHLPPGRFVVVALLNGRATSLTREPHAAVVVRPGHHVQVHILNRTI